MAFPFRIYNMLYDMPHATTNILHICYMLQDIRYTIYNMVLYFQIFQGCFEVLKLQYFKFPYMSPLLLVCITTYTTVSS